MKLKNRTSAACTRAVVLALLLLIALGTTGWSEERKLSSARVSLALGWLAFDQGNYEEAERLFLAAKDDDPEQGDALHWLGLTYLRLGRPAEAVTQLKASLKAEDPPAAGRRRVQSDLRLAREALEKRSTSPVLVEPPAYEPEIPLPEELPRWETRASLEAFHDSNPGLLPEDLLFPLPGHPSLQGASADEAARIDVGIEHHPFYSRGWSLGLALEGQHSLYQDQRDLNLSRARGTVSLAWGGSPLGWASGPLGSTRVPTNHNRISLLLQGGGAGIWLGGDSYLGLAEGALSLHLRESSRTATRFDLEASNVSYEEDGTDSLRRSGTEVAAGVSQYLYLGSRAFVRLGVAARERQAGRAFESSSGELLAEASAPLSSGWTLGMLGSWREDRFDHPESSLAIGRPKREDTTWRVTVASTFRVTDNLRWIVRGSHVRRDSNVLTGLGSPLFDYERTTFSLGIDWRP